MIRAHWWETRCDRLLIVILSLITIRTMYLLQQKHLTLDCCLLYKLRYSTDPEEMSVRAIYSYQALDLVAIARRDRRSCFKDTQERVGKALLRWISPPRRYVTCFEAWISRIMQLIGTETASSGRAVELHCRDCLLFADLPTTSIGSQFFGWVETIALKWLLCKKGWIWWPSLHAIDDSIPYSFDVLFSYQTMAMLS